MEIKIALITGAFVFAAAAIPIIFNYLIEGIKHTTELNKEYRDQRINAYSRLFSVITAFIKGDYSIEPDPNAVTKTQQMLDTIKAYQHKIWEPKTQLEAVLAENGIWLDDDEQLAIEKIVTRLEKAVISELRNTSDITSKEFIDNIEKDNFYTWVKELQNICKDRIKKMYSS